MLTPVPRISVPFMSARTRAQPFRQLRPPAPARGISDCDGNGFLLPDQHDQPLAARGMGGKPPSDQYTDKKRSILDQGGADAALFHVVTAVDGSQPFAIPYLTGFSETSCGY
jgi:hypothetical protein